jgi:hypothetical protein
MHSYRDVIWQYFEYFRDAAVSRAAEGANRADIWRAIWGAFRSMPLRTTMHIVGPRPLRRAFWSALTPQKAATETPSPSAAPASLSGAGRGND